MRLIVRIFQIVMALALLLKGAPSLASESVNPNVLNRIDAINGKQSFHDGPNCFNAVSYVHGFTNLFYQSSSFELTYNISQFCQENKNTPIAGDIILLKYLGSAYHAAIYLDSTTLFEKPTATGVESYYKDYDPKEPFWLKKNITESNYSYTCADIPDCEVKYYTCYSNKDAQEKKSKCENTEQGKEILKIKTLLNDVSLSEKKDITADWLRIDEEINKVIDKIEQIQTNDPCILEYVAGWTSIYWHSAYSKPQNSTWNPNIKKINTLFQRAKAKSTNKNFEFPKEL